MAARELVEYLIQVSTDTSKAKGGLARLVQESKAAAAGIGAVVAGFAAAGAGAVALANDLTDAVDRINTLAVNSGLAADTIKGLDALAASTGKDLKNLIPKDLPKRIKEAADGVGPAARGFETLGLSAVDAEGNLKSADTVLRETIDALGRIEDPTLKAAAAQQMFGARAQELTSALADRGDLDAWIGFADKYGTDVGPEAVRVTAKWQQSMAIFSQGVMAVKSGLMPLVDILANTVTGLTAMAVFAASAAGSLAKLNNPLKVLSDGFDGVSTWVSSIQDLNTELGHTATAMDRIADGYTQFAQDLGFDPGTQGLFGVLSNVTAGRGLNGEGPPSKPPTSGGSGKAGKREPDVLDMTPAEFAKLEQDQQAYGAELRAAREAQEQATKAVVTITERYDALGVQLDEEHYRSRQRSDADTLSGAAEGARSALSPVMAISGAIQDLAGIVGEAAGLIKGVTASIESLPEQLIALPESVTGLVDALGGLIPALIEASPEIAMAMGEAMFSLAFAHVDVVATALGAVFEQLPGDIAAAIAEALKGLVGSVNPFNSEGALGSFIAERVPFFEEGGHVARTGLAYLHEGETVSRAVDSVQMGGGGSGVVVQMTTPDPRMAAQDLSNALGPYGLGLSLGGVR